MFLVGVKAGLSHVVLTIHAPRLLRWSEIPRADARGDHDLRLARWINHRVATDLGRQVKRRKLSAGSSHPLKPPDVELIAARQGIDGNDGSGLGRRCAFGKGINVTLWIIVVAAGNVTGFGIAYWRVDAVADIYRCRQIRHAIGVGIVDRAHRRHGHERTAAIGIGHRRAAKFVLGLDVERHIPRRAVFHKFNQGSASVVAAGREVCQEAPADGVDRDFGLRRIVLVNHLRQVGGIKLRPRRQATSCVGHRHRLIAGKCRRPSMDVFTQILRPLN